MDDYFYAMKKFFPFYIIKGGERCEVFTLEMCRNPSLIAMALRRYVPGKILIF